jgi:hypothetical protein
MALVSRGVAARSVALSYTILSLNATDLARLLGLVNVPIYPGSR